MGRFPVTNNHVKIIMKVGMNNVSQGITHEFPVSLKITAEIPDDHMMQMTLRAICIL